MSSIDRGYLMYLPLMAQSLIAVLLVVAWYFYL
jgi:hypothetical protein